MDKGAHYYKCDFQVHTPRDIQWTGKRPTSPQDRENYAMRFVKKCREVGLQAVAITDHHDLAFFPYIKEASLNEVDENGKPIHPKDKLVVFPGIELTLESPPCQALLIFDADFPMSKLATNVLAFLHISANPSSEPMTKETVPISSKVVDRIETIYELFESNETTKGRFIVLPHVREKGHKTLLRSGFAGYYKSMPCVGGYVDGLVKNFGKGVTSILEGLDPNYGNKPLAVFQTSDNRSEKFDKLGKNYTYVKWAVPTAEAIRQACLAKESRLSNIEPHLPSVYITNIDVTNSKFLGSFQIDFNKQYNALIGGRGTGKSTILEYLRYGLCDSFLSGDSDLDSVSRKRQTLLDNTLKNFKGEVRVTFVRNGLKHIVKRSSVTSEVEIKIGESDYQKVSESEISSILPIHAYSQKQLSSVGVSKNEILRIIKQPIEHALSQLSMKISDNISRQIHSYQDYLKSKKMMSDIQKYKLELRSVSDQIKRIRESTKGISTKDQKVIASKPIKDAEQHYINYSKAEFESVLNTIEDVNLVLSKSPSPLLMNHPVTPSPEIQVIEKERLRIFQEIKAKVSELRKILDIEGMSSFHDLCNAWDMKKKAFDEEYTKVTEAASSNRSHLEEISRLEKREMELHESVKSNELQLNYQSKDQNEFSNLQINWSTLHEEKLSLLLNRAEEFSRLSNGLIRAKVSSTLDVELLNTIFTTLFSGMRIQKDRISSLIEVINNSKNPIKTWLLVGQEMQKLAETELIDCLEVKVPPCHFLSKANFSEKNLISISKQLSPQSWLTAFSQEIHFVPEFKYITDNSHNDEIPFSEASAGQQATALLAVLLNQTGAPLIIDQPEDDIDNRAIGNIISNIWSSKMKRQLIFTSHNANLVVNGDAELVICCDYRDSSSQTRGHIKVEGAIDSSPIKEEITSVMEGGEKAFRLRLVKYGF